ncbi:unnamed protein product [Mytilus coruscus]|uniref:Uncharacterized protein n=1 Tax=Mytilus coruscus TaxID=42192 RepID=A0A6J8CLU8_MYTCO|nr:unnamed protein product [Mytilus coruscus]
MKQSHWLEKRQQKPRLLKRVATAMMLLFETPEKVSTLEQPAVPVEPAVIEDCCHTSSLDSIEPVVSQPTPECDLLPFSTGMELVFTPSTARIVMDSHSDCVVAATAQEEGIIISGFSEEEIKTGQESDPDLMFILPYLKDGSEPLSNDLFLASPAAKCHWINKERFFMDDNGVLKSQPKTEGANKRLIVPASLRQTPFDTSVLDQATHRKRVRREEPVQEGPVDNTISLEVPVIPEVSVSREPEQGNPEETLEAREEIPAAQEEAPVAKKGSSQLQCPPALHPWHLRRKYRGLERVILSVLRYLSPARKACVAVEEYRGNNSPSYDVICQMNWRFRSSPSVAEPVVAQSISSVPVVQPTVQASAPVVQSTAPPSTPVVPFTVPGGTTCPKDDERKSAGRVTPTVEEPVTVAAPTSQESLVVLVYQNTKKMVSDHDGKRGGSGQGSL